MGLWSSWEPLSACLLLCTGGVQRQGDLWHPSGRAGGKPGSWMDIPKIMTKDNKAAPAWNITWEKFPNVCWGQLTLNSDYKFQKLYFCYFPGYTFLDKGNFVGSVENLDFCICWNGTFYVIFKPDLSQDSIRKFYIVIVSAIPTPPYWTLQSCLNLFLWPSP